MTIQYNPFDGDLSKIDQELERLLPLMLDDHDVSPEAYHSLQHAHDWIKLCRTELTTRRFDTSCPFCRHEFLIADSPIACPTCGYATDNWLGDEEVASCLDPDHKGILSILDTLDL